jgi:acetoin utilization deacetylase AcuC-like enzyme
MHAETFEYAQVLGGRLIKTCHALMDGKIKNFFSAGRPSGLHFEEQDPSE